MTSSEAGVGFIGLGNMGVPMARRLVEAGLTVVGCDISAEARRRAAAAGVPTTDRLADVAVGAQLVILMLPGSDAVAAVFGGTDLADHIGPVP